MSLLFTKPTACFTTFVVLASKLSVNRYRRAFHLEVAKRALREEVQPCRFNIFELLHMFETFEGLYVQHFLQLCTREYPVAVFDAEALRSAARLAHLSFDLLSGAVLAVEMGGVAIAADHTVERYIVEAAHALAHLVVHLCVLYVVFFELFCFCKFSSLS